MTLKEEDKEEEEEEPQPKAKSKGGPKPQPKAKDAELKEKHEQSVEDGTGVVLAAMINARDITEEQIVRLCESAQKHPASVIVTGEQQPAKWAQYLRTLDPNVKRGPRIEKVPDDVVASMINDAGSKKAWHPPFC